MHPARWSFRALLLTSAIACFALIGFAIFSQLQWGLEPCPLCIFQRLAFAALGIILLVAGVHAPRGVAGRRFYVLLGVAAAAVGVGIAGRHVWLQMHPPGFASCGAPFAFMRDTMDTPTLIQRVLTGTGDCGTVDWTFLGLSMPVWSLLWFVLLAVVVLYAGLRTQARRSLR